MPENDKELLTVFTSSEVKPEYLHIQKRIKQLKKKLKEGDGRKLIFADHYYNSLNKSFTDSALFAGYGNNRASAKVEGSRQARDPNIILYWKMLSDFSLLLTGRSIHWFKENVFGPTHVLMILMQMASSGKLDMMKYSLDKLIEIYEMIPEKTIKTENLNKNINGDLTQLAAIVKMRSAQENVPKEIASEDVLDM